MTNQNPENDNKNSNQDTGISKDILITTLLGIFVGLVTLYFSKSDELTLTVTVGIVTLLILVLAYPQKFREFISLSKKLFRKPIFLYLATTAYAIVIIATFVIFFVRVGTSFICQNTSLCGNSPSTSNGIISEANTKCLEFGGTPVKNENITSSLVEKWRAVGFTDQAGTGKVMYCEAHQIPGFSLFAEGKVIPEDAIISGDLGRNWEQTYPDSLERLVHDGGGWGIFLTTQPITIQGAADLQHKVEGLFWVVSR